MHRKILYKMVYGKEIDPPQSLKKYNILKKGKYLGK